MALYCLLDSEALDCRHYNESCKAHVKTHGRMLYMLVVSRKVSKFQRHKLYKLTPFLYLIMLFAPMRFFHPVYIFWSDFALLIVGKYKGKNVIARKKEKKAVFFAFQHESPSYCSRSAQKTVKALRTSRVSEGGKPSKAFSAIL